MKTYEIVDLMRDSYVAAMIWANTTDAQGEPITDTDAPLSIGVIEAVENALLTFVTYCREEILAVENTHETYSITDMGHDLALTRNRHGAGFWDRGLGSVGVVLTDAAHALGEENWTVAYRGFGKARVILN